MFKFFKSFCFFVFVIAYIKCDQIELAIRRTDLNNLKKELTFKKFKLTNEQKLNYKKIAAEVVESKRKLLSRGGGACYEVLDKFSQSPENVTHRVSINSGYRLDGLLFCMGFVSSILGVKLCTDHFPPAYSVIHYLKNSEKFAILRATDNTDLDLDVTDKYAIFQTSIVQAKWSLLLTLASLYAAYQAAKKKFEINEVRNAYIILDVINELLEK